MPDAKPFFDTHVLLYLLSEDTAKVDRAEELIANGAVISAQVLNEFDRSCLAQVRDVAG